METDFNKITILKYTLAYVKLKDIPHKKSGKMVHIQCPFCQSIKKGFTANFIIPSRYKIYCGAIECKKKNYDLIDIARKIEPDFNDQTPDETIIQHLKKLLDIPITTEIDTKEIVNLLDNYVKWGFDLVPIVNNGKIPIEKDWTNKEHKDKLEWSGWIKNNINLGIKTGKRSGITIIDIDQKPIPEEIDKIKGDCLIQESTKGYHLIYKYDPDFPKTRIDELKIDIENNGGQVVCYPSIINKVQRKFINIPDEITEIPKELKDFLMAKITVPRITDSEKVREDIETADFNLGILKEPGRNSALIRLGGLFRKELNVNQTKYLLNVLNKTLCDNPLPQRDINAMMGSIDKYYKFDEKELAHKILEYLRKGGEADRNEIAMAIVGTNRGEDKKRVDEALQYLVKEDHILKKGRSYGIIKKAIWKESLIETGKRIDFKMPYLYNVANFNWQDLILIGSKNKKGKSHIAINIIKQLVEQGKKPYYISLETGSRFCQIALQLGLKEGDFVHTFCPRPTEIQLEPNAITILDWLCPLNFAETDKLFMHFIEQLYKTCGFLIVFMQLKGSKGQDNEWFAPNLVSQFPALSTRYIYDNDGDGEYGKFIVDVIREPKLHIKKWEVPCRYNWEKKTLTLIEKENENKV